MSDIKKMLESYIDEHSDELIEDGIKMTQIPSENPPSNTYQMVEYIENCIKDIAGLEYKKYVLEEPKISLVAWLKGDGEGKHLIFNGHIDTFLVGDASKWKDSPFSGKLIDGKVYGRGSCDMKAGIAAYITMLGAMSKYRKYWKGEISVAFVSDEETAGLKGTKFILDTVERTKGDAMISGDVGSPRVLRFGEKGFLDFEINAEGVPAHGLHKHKGINAIDRLIKVLMEIEEFEMIDVDIPQKVHESIMTSKELSEKIDHEGEARNLEMVTVNVGYIQGGYTYSTIPASAKALVTIGLPAGITLAQIKEKLAKVIGKAEGVNYHIISETEPSWSDPEDSIFKIVQNNAKDLLNQDVVINMRCGFSDARYYRYEGIPAVACGVTEHAMGGPDEHFTVEDLITIAKIHTLSAYEFLKE